MLRVLYLEVYMFKGVSKVFFIAVMLITFATQAIAFNTSIPCETSVDSISPSTSKQVQPYDSNLINTIVTEDCCGIECCTVSCICTSNACTSFVCFNTDIGSSRTAALSEAVFIQPFEHPNSISTLLYRPPIITS
jgi:hypothetical protein